MTDHRLLTVRQPWAKPIVDGLKTVENRGRGFGITYRGPLWIHAGAAYSDRGLVSSLIHSAYPRLVDSNFRDEGFVLGAVIGHVIVTDAHLAEAGCCATPWAEDHYLDAAGNLVPEVTHLVFDPLSATPVRGPVVAGALGIWNASRRPGLAETLDHLAHELERGAPC